MKIAVFLGKCAAGRLLSDSARSLRSCGPVGSCQRKPGDCCRSRLRVAARKSWNLFIDARSMRRAHKWRSMEQRVGPTSFHWLLPKWKSRYDWRLVSNVLCRVPSGALDQMFVSVWQFLFCFGCALSDERTDLSFVSLRLQLSDNVWWCLYN
jgi:hypothetical protein